VAVCPACRPTGVCRCADHFADGVALCLAFAGRYLPKTPGQMSCVIVIKLIGADHCISVCVGCGRVFVCFNVIFVQGSYDVPRRWNPGLLSKTPVPEPGMRLKCYGDRLLICAPMLLLFPSQAHLCLVLSSSSCSDSGEDDEVQIVWAKAGRGIWGLGHVFEGKLYFTKDIVDDSFVPWNKTPNPVPKPVAKPAPKPAPKGTHVPCFNEA